MNFQHIPSIEQSTDILDQAFHRAVQKAKHRQIEGPWLHIIKKKELIKIDASCGTIIDKMSKILDHLPLTENLNTFYQRLMKLTLDYQKYQKACASINWAIQKVRELNQEHSKKISRSTTKPEIIATSKACFGRLSSILKQLKSHLENLETARKIMRTYPDIKEMFTICIYGFPNVGKTTLLNKLAETKAKVAAYPFTTRTINAGYIIINNETVQILDVPGTLARKEKMNNIELQAELVTEELANIIIYIFDISEYGGYSLEEQERLYQKALQKGKKILVFASKTDLIEPKTLFKHQYLTFPQLLEQIETEMRTFSSDNVCDRC